MALKEIAQGLRMNLYRVALKQVASKYIAETKKNVALIFEVAQKADAVLFFDEVDALFENGIR